MSRTMKPANASSEPTRALDSFLMSRCGRSDVRSSRRETDVGATGVCEQLLALTRRDALVDLVLERVERRDALPEMAPVGVRESVQRTADPAPSCGRLQPVGLLTGGM